MKKSKWYQSRKVEEEYSNTLSKLCSIFKRFATSSKGDVELFKKKMSKFGESPTYLKFAKSAAKQMVTPIAVKDLKTWREAARKATKGNLIYRNLLKNVKNDLQSSIDTQIARNVSIISTLPQNVSERVTATIAKRTFEGMRAKDIAKEISIETDKHSRASAKLIARTEVSKTTTALTRARAESAELPWYMWRTSEDIRVRDSHKKMNGVAVKWQDPPAPEILNGEQAPSGNSHYHAGEIYNCRCYPEPIIDIMFVKYPLKVHMNGQIITMGKKQFEEVY